MLSRQDQLRSWRTNLSPHQRWGISWTRICCWSFQAKHGWLRHILTKLPETCPHLEPELITSSLMDKTLIVVREWVRAGLPPPWSDCAGLSPEQCSWHLQFGNLSVNSDSTPPAMALQLVVPAGEPPPGVHSALSLFHICWTFGRFPDCLQTIR